MTSAAHEYADIAGWLAEGRGYGLVSFAEVRLSLAAGAATTGLGTGFPQPYLGLPTLAGLAPTQATNASQINQPIGQQAAEELGSQLGLQPLTEQQYNEMVSGRGVGGNAADGRELAESIYILTNTTGRPLVSDVNGVPTSSVLASYGVFVDPNGLLQSPGNTNAITRQVNPVVEPGGYMATWCRNNGATSALVALYKSTFPIEAIFGTLSQHMSGTAELVPNALGGVSTEVGMSMAPAIWLTNFFLFYFLNPALAADMPAYWAPLPAPVAAAIQASPTGQVPYSEYEPYFQ